MTDEELIGMTLAEASLVGDIRVLVQDGQGSAVTADFVRDRINVEVTQGRISKVVGRG